jgi:hypothetical protein
VEEAVSWPKELIFTVVLQKVAVYGNSQNTNFAKPGNFKYSEI